MALFQRELDPVNELVLDEIPRRRSETDLEQRDDVLSMLLGAKHEDGRRPGRTPTPEPSRFSPERFLDRPAGTYTWIPFGDGARAGRSPHADHARPVAWCRGRGGAARARAGRRGAGVTTSLTRKQRQAQTRKRLMESAMRVFSEEGLDGASIDAIAAAAGYTKGAFYANFESKDELFLTILDDRIDSRIKEVERVW
ncbi:MAG TPA: TetR family transcriptional regulator, partial [Thermoleophilaceae bacterium]|nr:TetR family transcriptional regulator [Thermoleophilaceae bacterium]